jgi:hypothetical protein
MNARGAVVQIAPYVRRLLDDEHVQDEVRELILDARRGVARAQRVGPERAITDKRLRRHMAAGATAATQIYKAFNEPKPPKRRRLRRLVTITVVGAGAVFAYRALSDTRESPG